jgi:hypothetical protein
MDWMWGVGIALGVIGVLPGLAYLSTRSRAWSTSRSPSHARDC